MGTGYTRNDTGNNIADGNVINASDLDGEFDAIQSAFNGSTGHSHDGTTGEGPQIDTAGIADDAVTNAKIGPGAVDTTELADDAVTGAKIDSTTTVTAASFVGPLTGAVTGNVTGDVSGNAGTATALATGRTVSLTGDVTGTSGSFDGTGNISITATIVDDSHNHVVGNIDNFTESVQDIAGAMFSGNTESGISAVYQDGDGTIDLNVNDPTITLDGDVSGSATMTNLGNVTITTAVANDSHTHDGRYFTETESDARYLLESNNLSDLTSASTARSNLGLGSLATLSTVNAATITDNSVGAAELNVSGNGSDGQALVSDGDGTMSWETISVDVYDTASSSTGYFDLPAGTTAQRPGSPANGMIRYNSTTGEPEVYAQGKWIGFYEDPSAYTIEYLIVAGGGGGGSGQGGSWGSGGGGAGGAVDSSGTVIDGTSYTVTVGAGAPQQTSNPGTGNNGSSSEISGISAVTSIGGGGGGADFGPFSTPGQEGGSGGGATSGSQSGGQGTLNQGNDGGDGAQGGGGGGGGATQVGEAGNTDGSGHGGDAGNGINWKSLGTTYAGGGGGGAYSGGTAGTGGSGGGGAGGSSGSNGTAGTANTGGGGGGSGSGSVNGGAGGSGIVIIRYQSGSQLGTGGTVTSSGGYYYHTFNSSGTFTA